MNLKYDDNERIITHSAVVCAATATASAAVSAAITQTTFNCSAIVKSSAAGEEQRELQQQPIYTIRTVSIPLLRPLRGDRRIPFGFRHVQLEAVSVESSGV